MVESTTDLELTVFKTYTHFEDTPSIRFHNVRETYLSGNKATFGSGTFLYVERQGSEDIQVKGNFLALTKVKIQQSKEMKAIIF